MKIKTLTDTATIPTRATVGSAGYDLYTDNDQDIWIAPGETVMIGTGLAMAIPCGWGGFIYCRSGLSTKEGITLANCTAVIDSDYRGEVKVPLRNLSDEARCIIPHQRVAQLVIMPYLPVTLEEVDELDETDRGAGGFGSTGR